MAETKTRITIIGVGLIGGSLGLAFKRAAMQGAEIVGHDADHGVTRRAEKLGAIDRAEGNLGRAVEGASIVVIATPILQAPKVMGEMAAHLATGAVVTDTASTKADVMKWAKERLPEGVSFVGGHPMAGKEEQGIENAEAGLFEGRAYCICPAIDADPSAIKVITGLARVVGAEPLYMDAEEHDQYAAAVSHLPLAMSAALFTLVRESPSWDDFKAMSASGFRDMTRLASGDAAMSHGIWTTNRDALIHWLERMMGELRRFRDMLQDAQDEQLLHVFTQAQMQRDAFIREPPGRQAPVAPEAERGASLMDMLVGRKVADSLRKAEKPAAASRARAREPGESAVEPGQTAFADRVAEGVKRDLEKLEQKRAEKQGREEDRGSLEDGG